MGKGRGMYKGKRARTTQDKRPLGQHGLLGKNLVGNEDSLAVSNVRIELFVCKIASRFGSTPTMATHTSKNTEQTVTTR